ncbi:hypothetical protein AVEN_32033-1 [Araneus ventricosus]|uniref:Uncharacterized protein n=1 Tax=Araneus ventricosus TaxID=182803 RepID=A0A4Y2JV90_ARAVE|nr:hypothetical protein AVEN_32033-1 [Araneus ventricosus]
MKLHSSGPRGTLTSVFNYRNVIMPLHITEGGDGMDQLVFLVTFRVLVDIRASFSRSRGMKPNEALIHMNSEEGLYLTQVFFCLSEKGLYLKFSFYLESEYEVFR